MRWRRLLAASACALLASKSQPVAAGKAKQPMPVAVEARFKERLTAKLEASLSSALGHMAWALGLDTDGAVFGQHYELDLASEGWRTACEKDISTEYDSISHCAIRKLQALTAFCEVESAAQEHRDAIQRLLKQLLQKRETIVPGMGIKRSLLPIGNGIEAWMSELKPGSGNYDVIVPLHAAAMAAVVQCGSSLNMTEPLAEAHGWFAAIEKAYPPSAWAQNSFHLNAILWESFVLIYTMVRPGSSFAEELQDFLDDFDAYLQAQFDKEPKAWSFSGARAAVLSWVSAKKASRRKRFGKMIDEYMNRWKEIGAAMQTKEMYTCGPLQGVAPLLLKRGDQAAELVSSVLALAEKDVDLFQILGASEKPEIRSIAAQRLGDGLLGKHAGGLEGAFLRDEAQLKNDKRRSIRIDDTAQCIMGMYRTLQLLDDLVGVEVEQGAGGAKEQSSEAGRSDL